MLTLGMLLRMLLDTRKINVSVLSEKLGVSRSVLYRYLSEKVLMPKGVLNKIAVELMLTPVETSMLNEAFEAASIGMDKYECRKIIADIFAGTDFAAKRYGADEKFNDDLFATISAKQSHALFGTESIGYAIRYVFEEALRHGLNVFVYGQPDNELVMSEIERFVYAADHAQQLKHIYRLCQGETMEIAAPLAFNMNLQKRLLCIGTPLSRNYFPSFYYDYSISSRKSPILHPIRIVSNNTTLFFSSDNQKAVLIQDKEIAGLYFSELENLHESIAPLVFTSNCIDRVYELSKHNEFSSPELTIADEPSAFFARAGAAEMLNMMRKEKKAADSLRKQKEKNTALIKKGMIVRSYFTIDGLNRFIETGLMACGYKGNLSRQIIKDYLINICEYAKTYENVSVNLITEKIVPALEQYNLFIYNTAEIWQTKKADLNRLYVLREKSTVQAISDYLFNVFPSTLNMLGKTETVSLLESKVAEM